MSVLHLVAALGFIAIIHGQQMPQSQSNVPSVVPGVFISADAFKSLQDRANANPNQGYQSNTNGQNLQPVPNQSYQPNSNIQNPQPSYQPVNTNQPQYQYAQPSNNQPIITVQPANNQPMMTVQPANNQPMMTVQPANNQPMITVQPANTQPMMTVQPSNYQPIMTVQPTNQPNSQPGQPIIYVQQQLPNRQTILVPQTQSNQPAQPAVVYSQPNQGTVAQNGQPTMIASNPNGNQVQGSNSNPVYTLIPLSR